MANRYKIYTLGCKVNQYESSLLKTALDSIGFTESSGEADFVIVNTCSVTGSAVSKDGKIVNKARKENPQASLYLMGCLTRVDKNTSDKLKVDKISQSVNPADILKDFGLEELFEKNKEKIKTFGNFNRTRYFLKIQDGCEQFCSYCIIPYARGKMKSRKENDIIEEIKMALNMGYNEIVLSGIHIGLFGKEKGNIQNTSLALLLKKIIEIKRNFRIRISSIEITEVNNQLIDLIKSSNKICNHLHISLQSGSDKILKEMNRPYNVEYFQKRVKKIRKAIPDIAISTDIIVGFPGETDDLFKETYQLSQKIGFSKIHVFSFSAHKKTKAYSMKNQVLGKEKKERSTILRKLSRELEIKFRDKFRDKKLNLLIEKIDGNLLTGKSEYHFDIQFENDRIVQGGRKNILGNIIETKY